MLICQKESAAALNQLSKMREQLDKKQEDLGGLPDENTPGPPGVGAGAPGQRRESIWNGLAEIWGKQKNWNKKTVFCYHEQWDKTIKLYHRLNRLL